MQNNSTVGRSNGKQVGISRWSGFSLVLLGGGLLAVNLLTVQLENWWALFILMPALALFGFGSLMPRNANGRFSLISRFLFASGLIVFVVAMMFLLNMDWGIYWPLMITSPGVGLIIVGGKSDTTPTTAAWIGYLRWVAASLIGLGITFLSHTLGIINLDSFGELHWWAVFAAIPAIGALLQAIWLYGRLSHISLSVVGLISIAFFSGGSAVFEWLAIPWSSFYGITAVFFIGSGLMLLLNGLRRTSE